MSYRSRHMDVAGYIGGCSCLLLCCRGYLVYLIRYLGNAVVDTHPSAAGMPTLKTNILSML